MEDKLKLLEERIDRVEELLIETQNMVSAALGGNDSKYAARHASQVIHDAVSDIVSDNIYDEQQEAISEIRECTANCIEQMEREISMLRVDTITLSSRLEKAIEEAKKIKLGEEYIAKSGRVRKRKIKL